VQIVRIVLWVVLLFALLVFSWANWDSRISVQIWDELIVETNAPALMIVSFLLGFVPLWLLHRTSRWRLNRRVRSLEKAIRDSSGPAPSSSTQPLQPDDGIGSL
jgi:putative membrane protein